MDWTQQHCQALDSNTPPMSDAEVTGHLEGLAGWKLTDGALEKTYSFKNYYQTTAFVNAAVWIAHQEDHHPDITFGYKTCLIRYSTHSVGGLSANDFICAAKTDALFAASDA